MATYKTHNRENIKRLRQELSHGCDGPVTPFVLICRAVPDVDLANALYDELVSRSWLKPTYQYIVSELERLNIQVISADDDNVTIGNGRFSDSVNPNDGQDAINRACSLWEEWNQE